MSETINGAGESIQEREVPTLFRLIQKLDPRGDFSQQDWKDLAARLNAPGALDSMVTIYFNVNNHVKVKLTEDGESILQDRYAKSPYLSGHADSILAKKDDEGYVKFQLWDLISIFGPYMALGRRLPFDAIIQFETG